MRIEILASQWGNNVLPAPVFIERVKAAGFDGIDMSLPLDGKELVDWTRQIRFWPERLD